MQFPILIGLRRSFLQRLLIWGVSGLALLLPIVVAWPDGWRLAFVLTVVVLFGLEVRRLRQPLPALLLEKQGQLAVRGSEDEAFADVDIMPPVTVHPWLIVLSYRTSSGQRHRLAIFPDSTSAGQHRRLRVWLRQHAGLAQARAKPDVL